MENCRATYYRATINDHVPPDTRELIAGVPDAVAPATVSVIVPM